MSLVSIENVHKYYGSHHVLKGIDLKIAAGEVISIIGRSGSGKSTLLRCINGLEKFDNGAIIVDRQAVSDDENHLRELSRSVGMVFQNFNLFPQYTALQNVTLAEQLLAQERPDFKADKKKILEEINSKYTIITDKTNEEYYVLIRDKSAEKI